MNRIPASRLALFFIYSALVILLAACSSSHAPITSIPAPSTLKEGTILNWYHSHVPIFGVSWSPDGKRIVSGDASGLVQVRDVATGRVLFKLRGHTGTIWAVAWSPDSTRVSSGYEDGTIEVWYANTGSFFQVYHHQQKGIQALGWSPDGMQIASGSWDSTVQIWNASNGKTILTYRGHSSSIGTLAWSPEGKRIASVADDLQIWQAGM